MKTRYFSNDFSSVLRTNTNLSNVLSEHPIIFDGFQQKSDTFQMFWVKVRLSSKVRYQIRYFPNVLYQIRYFRRFCLKSLYFSDILGQNQILLKCFEQNFDTFPIFLAKKRCISSVLRTNTNLSNVLSENPISFQCFQQKSDTFKCFG